MREYDTSHLNTSLNLDITPIKVSEIIGQHTPIVSASTTANSTGLLRLEDIDNSKNVIEYSGTIDDFFNESFKGNVQKSVSKNKDIKK